MDKMPLFSVLIANYNNGKYLMDAINSIHNQTYKNWEIIIVDDCSTDISGQVYHELENEGNIRIYYNSENKGCGFTKRRCIEESKGEICGFLDPDDALVENALEKMIYFHNVNKETAFVHSRFYYCDSGLNIESVGECGEYVESGIQNFFNLKGEITAFCSFKKEYYNKTDGINPFFKRAVDQDLYMKLYEVGNTFFIDEPLYYYRIHEGGISTRQNARKAYFWHWLAIFSTLERRNINFEEEFYNNFIPKYEYDYIQNKFNKYRKIDRIIEKTKNYYNRIFK